MGKFIKENWFKIAIIVIILIVIGGIFYWFQLRPAQIRKECTENSYIDKKNQKYFLETSYSECLKKHGLEK
jgi:hypothetical protein